MTITSPGGQAVARRSAPGRESGNQPPQQEATRMTAEEKKQLEDERNDLATLIHQTTGRRLD